MPDSSCSQCGTEIPAAIPACPSCGALVHAAELKRLAQEAATAPTAAAALAAWRAALHLLPQESRQYAVIVGKIDVLRAEADRDPTGLSRRSPKPERAPRKVGLIGLAIAVIALLVKFKFAIVFLLTKGKLLLLGLTNATTFFTMFASFGIYWSLWGWKFAAGILLAIYVHEMGHVDRLRRYGIRASAPMFIPGLGALIRLRETLPTAIEDARVGLAGPIWGLGASVAAWLLSIALHSPFLAALAGVNAWINLFNLMPVWQLDGGRAFRALSRLQRWIAVAAVGAATFITQDFLLPLIAICGAFRGFGKDAPQRGDMRTLLEYVGLVGMLCLMMRLK